MNSIIHVIGSLNRSGGGPPRSVSVLCDALVKNDSRVTLATQMLNHEVKSSLVLPQSPLVDINISAAYSISKLRITYSPRFYASLLNLIKARHANIIHSHSLWLPCNHAAAKASHKCRIPHIVSPRGTLSPWAFNYRKWKKLPVWFLWQRAALCAASGFCATSHQEAIDIRSKGFRQPIAIIPNGIDFPKVKPKCQKPNHQYKTALFLSRIHPIKGVCELVQAWAKVRPTGWKVVIAGPNEENHLSKVMNEISRYALDDQFEIVGEVSGTAKDMLYQSADLFILPSFTENFGIVVAEALASGTPVITTKGSPWQSVEVNRCGWWIDVGVNPLADAIQVATKMSFAELSDMGTRGQAFVEKEFFWPSIAQKTLMFYDWILGRVEKPDFVID